ncbi:5-formyltetrahydrofolate cyclo-ligase [Paenibacillus chondroitinus]|uniref:5-formyltetrahydrofolate cyclo-ligase n=1 Tax=Paenibacillus chondroitinus TaxID=59842 RepID=A0ABU6DAW4_9BACL|nr:MULTISPECIES: 5-formyltetrahydrofolate cyclo-ligase [Paenibacillus]MCY9657489.1 5-formyltetrahydrofolate cyclo-ligase [Paenibacillus anseongense]MEB4794891.1 5-formyltetrahydrofolate cyclo-ligase [Paenibacillus chondroitinus]
MNIRERKIELRKDMEELRSSITAEEREEKQQRIHERMTKLCSDRLLGAQQQEASVPPTIMTYMPFRSELDVAPLMEWCWQQGIRVLVPKVVADTKTMNLHIIHAYDDLESGAWGIREPHSNVPIEQDLSTISMILVPGLAFDMDFGRLGYGGGFYDRFMQLFAARGLKRPFAVAAAFDKQLIPAVPSSWHDFRVDGIVTESKMVFKTET